MTLLINVLLIHAGFVLSLAVWVWICSRKWRNDPVSKYRSAMSAIVAILVFPILVWMVRGSFFLERLEKAPDSSADAHVVESSSTSPVPYTVRPHDGFMRDEVSIRTKSPQELIDVQSRPSRLGSPRLSGSIESPITNSAKQNDERISRVTSPLSFDASKASYEDGIPGLNAGPIFVSRTWSFWVAWGMGMGMVVVLGFGAMRLRVTLNMLSRCTREMGASWREQWVNACDAHPRGLRVALYRSKDLHAPACWGLWFPRLLLPMKKLDPKTLLWAMRHEWVHIQRRDALAATLEFAMLTLFWWHPAAWWLSSRARRWREHSCDSIVVSEYGSSRAYALALLECASHCNGSKNALNPALIHWIKRKSSLKRRFEMLAMSRLDGFGGKAGRRLIGFGAVVAILGLGELTLSATMLPPQEADVLGPDEFASPIATPLSGVQESSGYSRGQGRGLSLGPALFALVAGDLSSPILRARVLLKDGEPKVTIGESLGDETKESLGKVDELVVWIDGDDIRSEWNGKSLSEKQLEITHDRVRVKSEDGSIILVIHRDESLDPKVGAAWWMKKPPSADYEPSGVTSGRIEHHVHEHRHQHAHIHRLECARPGIDNEFATGLEELDVPESVDWDELCPIDTDCMECPKVWDGDGWEEIEEIESPYHDEGKWTEGMSHPFLECRKTSSGRTPLEIAIDTRHEEVVHRLLIHGADPNGPVSQGISPLWHAFLTLGVDSDIARYLLEHGADPNATGPDGQRPLNVAIEMNDEELLGLLLDRGASPDARSIGPFEDWVHTGAVEDFRPFEGVPTPLQKRGGVDSFLEACVDRDRMQFIPTLLEHGADPSGLLRNGDSLLHWAIREGHRDLIQCVLGYGPALEVRGHDGKTPLEIAIETEEPELVGLLLSHGANVHGATPDQSWEGNAEATWHPTQVSAQQVTMFEGSSDVHEYIGETFVGQQRNGYLVQAIKCEREDIALLLLEHGACASVMDSKGDSAIHLAYDRNMDRAIDALLARSADLNRRDHNGIGLLEKALRAQDDEFLRRLIDGGASVNESMRDGRRPLHWAIEEGDEEWVGLLLDAGADPNAGVGQPMSR